MWLLAWWQVRCCELWCCNVMWNDLWYGALWCGKVQCGDLCGAVRWMWLFVARQCADLCGQILWVCLAKCAAMIWLFLLFCEVYQCTLCTWWGQLNKRSKKNRQRRKSWNYVKQIVFFIVIIMCALRSFEPSKSSCSQLVRIPEASLDWRLDCFWLERSHRFP